MKLCTQYVYNTTQTSNIETIFSFVNNFNFPAVLKRDLGTKNVYWLNFENALSKHCRVKETHRMA